MVELPPFVFAEESVDSSSLPALDTKATASSKLKKCQRDQEMHSFGTYYDYSASPGDISLHTSNARKILRGAYMLHKEYPRCESEQTFGRQDCEAIQSYIANAVSKECPISHREVWETLMYAHTCFKQHCILMFKGMQGIRFDHESGKASASNPNAENYNATFFNHQNREVIDNFKMLRVLFRYTWKEFFNKSSSSINDEAEAFVSDDDDDVDAKHPKGSACRIHLPFDN